MPSASDPSLVRFRAVVGGALQQLEARRQEINDLNVFPVADGDTGDNMALTLGAVYAELDRLVAETPAHLDPAKRVEVVESLARAALLGARGNSGVILSQLIRGAAEELISRPGELVDPMLLGAAMARAAQRAYESVRAPAEGTILTVMREMAASVATALPHLQRLAEGIDAAEQDAILADVLEEAVHAGEAAVARGPELLPVLREAGVVDAGGHGVTIIFAGVVAALRGTEPPEIKVHAAPVRVTHPEHDSSTFRYCTNFAVTGEALDQGAAIAALEALGDSVLVVGDPHTLKVHVHTDDPDAATGALEVQGEVSHLDVADMHAQVRAREAALAGRAHGGGDDAPMACCGVVAVAHGAGMVELLEAEGAEVVDGGPTLNPSTRDLLAGIHRVRAEQVVLLPSSANVHMAAQHAAELSDKDVRVVATRTMQASLAAAFALRPSAEVDENAAAMQEAVDVLRTGGIAPAAREDPSGRWRIGDAVGFVGDDVVAWGAPRETLGAVLHQLGEGSELLTVIAGEGAPLSPDDVDALRDGVELEQLHGGQPAWWWLVSAE